MKVREIVPPEGYFRPIHLHVVIESVAELDDVLAGLSEANVLDDIHDILLDLREEMKL